jgi:hypothetical protein
MHGVSKKVMESITFHIHPYYNSQKDTVNPEEERAAEEKVEEIRVRHNILPPSHISSDQKLLLLS